MAVNVFDQSARFAVQPDPTGFFRWLFPGLEPDLSFQGWLDTRTLPFPGEPDRICDTVAHLAVDPAKGPSWAVVTEFQTDPEPDMLDRLLEYLARLRRGLRQGAERRDPFVVVAALVSLRGGPQPGTLEMALPNLAVPSLAFSAAVRTLREDDAAATLDGIAAGLISRSILSWVSLMRGADDRGIIQRWKELADAEPDPRNQACYATVALVFAELNDRADLWRTELEGWNMRESTLVNEWKSEAKLEGRLEGKREGKLEGEREALLRVLSLKYPGAVPAEITAAIAAIDDLDDFAVWFDKVIRSSTLEEVLAWVSSSKPNSRPR